MDSAVAVVVVALVVAVVAAVVSRNSIQAHQKKSFQLVISIMRAKTI